MSLFSLPAAFSVGAFLRLLLVAALIATVGLAVLSLVATATIRLLLYGGVVEARLRYFFLRRAWLLCFALAVAGVWILWQGRGAAGVLVLLGAGVLAVPSLPFLRDMIYDFAIVHRLAAHLWNRRAKIEKIEKRITEAQAVVAVAVGEDVPERKVSDAEAKDRKAIEERFLVDHHLFRRTVYSESQDGHPTVDMLREAAQEAGPTSFDQMLMGPAVMAYTFEALSLFIVGAAVLYSAWGLRIAAAAGVDWVRPFLLGLAAAIVVSLALALYRAASLAMTPWPCIVCEKSTRRRVRLGAGKVHVCGDECLTKFRRLFG